MISLGLIAAGLLVVLGAFSRMDVKPSLCPRCRRRSLIPDHRGVIWRCVPCEAEYLRVGTSYVARGRGGPEGERIPMAKMRKPDDE
ncbi:hypothetical protein BH11MYX3_BH11MYX3_37840 [soil metagenome]